MGSKQGEIISKWVARIKEKTDAGILMQEIVFLCHIVTESKENSRYNR